MSETHYDLKQLRAECERILATAPGMGWKYMHCIAALRCEDDEGHVSYRVEIEEASPDDERLRRFVHEQLVEAGFRGVEVYTEW